MLLHLDIAHILYRIFDYIGQLGVRMVRLEIENVLGRSLYTIKVQSLGEKGWKFIRRKVAVWVEDLFNNPS